MRESLILKYCTPSFKQCRRRMAGDWRKPIPQSLPDYAKSAHGNKRWRPTEEN